MKNLAITVFIVLLIVLLGLVFVSFQVRQTESALVTRFGRPVRQLTEPGFCFKWPFPIERVHKFDSRLRVLEADLGETTTKGAAPIIVKTYIVWRIAEPLGFFNAVGTLKEAQTKLLGQIGNIQNEVIGRHYFSEFVNSDPNRIKFEQIQQEMLSGLRQNVRAAYGIEVASVGIKQLKVSEDVSKDVFERMKAERDRKTKNTISEGQAEADKIRADADAMKKVILAAAENRAKLIRAQGDAEAAQYYKMLEADPQLAMFLRDIEALKKTLEQRATIVISADSEPFKLLKQMPDIAREQQGK